MRISGHKQLNKKLKKLPVATRAHMVKSIERNVKEGVKVARTLVPEDTGEHKGWIHAKFDDEGLTGSVEAAPPEKEAQIASRALEFGRKESGKGARPYMMPTQAYLAKKHKNSIKRAVKKAARETFNV